MTTWQPWYSFSNLPKLLSNWHQQPTTQLGKYQHQKLRNKDKQELRIYK